MPVDHAREEFLAGVVHERRREAFGVAKSTFLETGNGVQIGSYQRSRASQAEE